MIFISLFRLPSLRIAALTACVLLLGCFPSSGPSPQVPITGSWMPGVAGQVEPSMLLVNNSDYSRKINPLPFLRALRRNVRFLLIEHV